MKKLFKLLSVLLALAMMLALAACGSSGGTSDPGSAPSSTSTPSTNDADASSGTGDTSAGDASDGGSAADGATYTVGICQLVQHDALDQATQGFKDALTEKLGDAVSFKEGNASGDSANCSTIIDGFLSDGVDLILANATAPLQAAAAATSEIPILGTSITDYATALEIDDWTGTVGSNISGTSDLAPLDQQADMLHEMFPDAQNVGLLYCSGEPNSVYQCDVITGYLEEYGYTVERYAFTDTNDVTSVAQTAADNSDVIYIPTDNTAASYASTIHNVVVPAGVPVITGDTGTCSGCGVAVLGIDYYELGQITGEMAYEILVEGADPATMEVRSAPTPTKMYNPSICEELGITPPEDYTALES